MERKNEIFEEYFLKYKNLVIRVVMDRSGDYQLAQEICQQVYVAFYKNMEKISPELVKAWLMRCTQNALIDHYRRSKVKREVYAEDIMPMEAGNLLVEKSVEKCEDCLAKKELVGKILREVKQVNLQWYEVLVLHCIEELSHAEAAKRLNVSETVFRARLSRARAYIRKTYGDEYREL